VSQITANEIPFPFGEWSNRSSYEHRDLGESNSVLLDPSSDDLDNNSLKSGRGFGGRYGNGRRNSGQGPARYGRPYVHQPEVTRPRNDYEGRGRI
jgi:hypothetical protein